MSLFLELKEMLSFQLQINIAKTLNFFLKFSVFCHWVIFLQFVTPGVAQIRNKLEINVSTRASMLSLN